MSNSKTPEASRPKENKNVSFDLTNDDKKTNAAFNKAKPANISTDFEQKSKQPAASSLLGRPRFDEIESSYDPDSEEPQVTGEDDEDDDDANVPKPKKIDLDLDISICAGKDGQERFVEIPNLEEDISYLKDKNIQPIDYFLDQCQKYAAANLMQIEKIIAPY